MKKLTTKVMIATAALVVAAGVASAQTMTAQIPFEFRAGNQVMAPGTYQVDNLNTQTGIPIYRLLDVNSHRSIALLAQARVDPEKGWAAGNPKLLFACTSGSCVLANDGKFMRRLCMNCAEPACASVCPVAALRKTPEGPVIYEASRCMGCRYCMVACPFSVPKYEWNQLAPRVQKCTMCASRVVAGKPTACAEICPTGATKFGDRDELIAEAQQPNVYLMQYRGIRCVTIEYIRFHTCPW